MTEELNQTKQDTTKHIQSYSIVDFAKDLQEAFEQGYKINLEDNHKYPQQIGVVFSCTLDLYKKEDIINIENTYVTGVVQPTVIPSTLSVTTAKQGRPSKVK